jgi:hypothetical protein
MAQRQQLSGCSGKICIRENVAAMSEYCSSSSNHSRTSSRHTSIIICRFEHKEILVFPIPTIGSKLNCNCNTTAIKTFPQKKHQDISNAFSLHFVSASQFPNVLPYSRKKLHWEIDCDDYVLKRTNSI